MSYAGPLALYALRRAYNDVVIPPRPLEPLDPGVSPPTDPLPDDITTQAETTTWLATLSQAPQTLGTYAVNVLLKRAKDHSWYNDFPVILVCAACGPKADKLKDIKGAITAPVFHGTIYDNDDFHGLIGDGLTGFVDLGKKMTDLSGVGQDDWMILQFLTSNNVGVYTEIGAFETINNQIGLRGSSGFRSGMWMGSSSQILFGGADAIGLLAEGTDGANICFGQRNVIRTVFPRVSKAFPNVNLFLLRSSAATNNISPNSAGLYLIGKTQNSTKMTAIVADIAEFFDLLDVDLTVPQQPAGPAAFDKDDINSVSPGNLEIEEFAAPPKNDTVNNDTFNYFPGSRYTTAAHGAFWNNTLTWTVPTGRNGGVGTRGWVYRGLRDTAGGPVNNPTVKANDIVVSAIKLNGLTCAALYSTKPMARYAALAFKSHQLGAAARNEPRDRFGRGYLDWYEAGGGDASKVVTRAYAEANAATVFADVSGTYGSTANSLDYLILEDQLIVDLLPAGYDLSMVDDNEPADSGGASLLTEYMLAAGGICQDLGARYWSWNHILDGTSGVRDGWSNVSAPTIMQSSLVSYFGVCASLTSTIQTTTQLTASLDSQIALATGAGLDQPITWSKVRIIFQMGTTYKMTVAHAQAVKNWMTLHSVTHISFLRAGALEGGPLSNQVNQVKATLFGLSLT